MTLHRMDLPDKPVRVYRSYLNPKRWIWRCMDNPVHRMTGFATWADAWADMEKHRREVHEVQAVQPRFAKGGRVFGPGTLDLDRNCSYLLPKREVAPITDTDR